VDWNNDGILDILSGCYWTEGSQAGHIMLLAGQGGLQFAEAVPLTNASGAPLENVSLTEEQASGSGNEILDAICTQQFAVDYDGDGDLDLIVGSFGHKFFYYENLGDANNPQLSETPVELPIRSPDYHSAPHLVDWNGNGKLDFITGSSTGAVYISFNEGTREVPKWGEFQTLIPATGLMQQSTSGGKEIIPASGTRVWAYDWNGNGQLDLVVGDSVTIANPVDGLSEEEFVAKEAEFNQKSTELAESRGDLHERYQKAAEAGDISAELQKEMQEFQQSFMKLYQSRSEWVNERMTGHVWVFLRKQSTDVSVGETDKSDSGN
jgi:hypothetical protein